MYHKYSIIDKDGFYVKSWSLVNGDFEVVRTKNVLFSLGFSSRAVAKRFAKIVSKYSKSLFEVV